VIEVDFEVCQAAGVPLIAYKNKALRAPIHVESLGETKEILKLPGRPTITGHFLQQLQVFTYLAFQGKFARLLQVNYEK